MKPILKKLASGAFKSSAKAPAEKPARFLVIGLPRSGSTYLITLLNAHRDVFCSGEQFNHFAIVGVSSKDDDHESVLARDRTPIDFMENFFAEAANQRVKWTGFKFMIGHNIEVMKYLATQPDITLIYVWRENKLAQVSSWIKATNSKNWAQSSPNAHIEAKIDAKPRQISQRWHEYAALDHLFAQWLSGLPNRRITLEYREMFQPGFEESLCDFLEIAHDPNMKSPLLKQSTNDVLDRFKNPNPINNYFRKIGYGRWLESEL